MVHRTDHEVRSGPWWCDRERKGRSGWLAMVDAARAAAHDRSAHSPRAAQASWRPAPKRSSSYADTRRRRPGRAIAFIDPNRVILALALRRQRSSGAGGRLLRFLLRPALQLRGSGLADFWIKRRLASQTCLATPVACECAAFRPRWNPIGSAYLGGDGSPLLLVHGLAGYAGEWERSARWLGGEYRVFALDQRGHGDSARRPRCLARRLRGGLRGSDQADRARAGHVCRAIDGCQHRDACGGRAPRPRAQPGVDRGLPGRTRHLDAGLSLRNRSRRSLSAWPVPFADERAAEAFFRSRGFDPAVWTGGLERREDGLWPKWDLEAMVACAADLDSRNFWAQWRSIRCPTLVVLGERGIFPSGHGAGSIAQLPSASLTRSPSRPDVHLDAPEAWVAALRSSPPAAPLGIYWRPVNQSCPTLASDAQNRPDQALAKRRTGVPQVRGRRRSGLRLLRLPIRSVRGSCSGLATPRASPRARVGSMRPTRIAGAVGRWQGAPPPVLSGARCPRRRSRSSVARSRRCGRFR